MEINQLSKQRIYQHKILMFEGKNSGAKKKSLEAVLSLVIHV